MKDDSEGIDLRLRPTPTASRRPPSSRAILNSDHHSMQDFSVTIPAALLAQQQRTQTIFTYVMVAIAAISLSGWRHRHHEHRPRHRYGAHPRDRHPPFHRAHAVSILSASS